MLALVREVSPQFAQCQLTHLERAAIDAQRAMRQHGDYTQSLQALGQRTRVSAIAEPGCLDGGDVLRIGRTLHVGVSGRTNEAGIAQLAQFLAPYGYGVEQVALEGCLHLKSAASFIPPDVLLVNPAWVEPSAFGEVRVIAVDEREPLAANTLTIGGTTLVSAAYPHTCRCLEAAGVRTRSVDVSELHKAEGGLTCMSLLLP